MRCTRRIRPIWTYSANASRVPGVFFLVPAFAPGKNPQHAEVYGDLESSIRFCSEWEIGEHDPDSLAVQLDDDPVLPENMLDVPFVRLVQLRCGKTKQ
jgi:hypothetical protein